MSFQFALLGSQASDIETLTEEDLFGYELTNELYELEDKSEFLRLKGLLVSRAKRLGCAPDFKSYLSELEARLDSLNDSEDYAHQTNFGVTGMESLNCGNWIADRKGIRKKNAKLFASLSPIQPIEILENKTSGTEKVRLQFFKNGKLRTIITERNTIAAKSQIVKLASRGIEVTSETAGQLVQYLSDVINLNDLPVSTAYSQMGWHGDMFIPYDPDAIFDGEENHREIFNAFNSKGKYKEWLKVAAETRESIYMRLAQDAAFASVLLDRVDALPFVFHLWGKTGAGKTVALKNAMAIWGDPEKAVRSLNTTQNALLETASVLNSLPFAGDELQTIKTNNSNYDKFLMAACEGINRGRMIDGQRTAEIKRWKCAFLFTGEDKCTRPNSGAGAKNRCIEVEVDSDITNGKGNAIVSVLDRNYGHAGPIFIEKLKEIDPETLKFQYNTLVMDLAKRAGTEPKQAAAMAAIMLADSIANELFFPGSFNLTFSDVIPFMATSEEIDISERAYYFTLDLIAQHYNKFTGDGFGEIWGAHRHSYVLFNAKVLREELQKEGFELNSVLQSWSRKRYIELAPDGKSTISTWVNGIKGRYMHIILPEEETKEEQPETYDGVHI